MSEKLIASEFELQDDDTDIPEILDFSKAIRNPYISKLRKNITLNIPVRTLNYFRDEADNMGVSYETLINLYLNDCANNKRKFMVVNE